MATLDSSVPTFVSKVRGHSSNYQKSEQKDNSGVLYLIHCLPSDSRVLAGETRVEELYGLACVVSYATLDLQGNKGVQKTNIRMYISTWVPQHSRLTEGNGHMHIHQCLSTDVY